MYVCACFFLLVNNLVYVDNFSVNKSFIYYDEIKVTEQIRISDIIQREIILSLLKK